MWLLARHELKLSRFASFVAAAAWAFNGAHQQHYAGGHSTFVPFEYFPLALLLWRRAEDDRRYAVGLGLLVAWMLYEGAVYPTPHLAILLGAEALTRAWPVQRALRIVEAGLIAGVVGLSLAASRILPVVDQLRSHTRPIDPDVDALQWGTFKLMFVERGHERHIAGQQYVWPEFGAYLGVILVVLAVAGIIYAGRRRIWMLALLLLMVALMFGHAGTWAPWDILHGHVFPFKEMRVPSRFRFEVTMFLAAYAGIAVDGLSRTGERVLGLTRGSAVRVAVCALALIGVGDMMGVGIDWFRVTFRNAPEQRPLVASQRLYFGGPGLADFIDQPQQNRGRTDCWDEWGFGAGAPLWHGDVPQARSGDPNVVVEVANRTQNTFTIDVDAKRPGRITLNSPYDRGWQTDVGTTGEQNKVLVLDVPEGRQRIRIVYRPRWFGAGVAVSILGTLGVAAWVVWQRKRRRRRA
jgi:hypothetical protein